VSTAPEDTVCRYFHGTSPFSTPRVFFYFHVLYDNAISFDSYLRSVWFASLEPLDAAANRTSRLDGECGVIVGLTRMLVILGAVELRREAMGTAERMSADDVQ
jgi:hypothetical protein